MAVQRRRQTALDDEKTALSTELEKKLGVLHDREREHHVLSKDYNYAKDREAVLMGDRWAWSRNSWFLVLLLAFYLSPNIEFGENCERKLNLGFARIFPILLDFASLIE